MRSMNSKTMRFIKWISLHEKSPRFVKCLCLAFVMREIAKGFKNLTTSANSAYGRMTPEQKKEFNEKVEQIINKRNTLSA